MLFKFFRVSESIWHFLGNFKKYKYPELCAVNKYIDKVTILLKQKLGYYIYSENRKEIGLFQKILKSSCTMNLKDISGKNYGNESRVELIPNPHPHPPEKILKTFLKMIVMKLYS